MSTNQLLVGLSLTASLSAFAGTELKLNSGIISTQVQTLEIAHSSQTEWIVQFKNHVHESDKLALRAEGLKIHSYLPEDAFIVRGTSAQIAKVKTNQNIQTVLAFAPHMKLSPTLGIMSAVRETSTDTVIVSVFEAQERAAIANKIQKLSARILIQKSVGTSIVLTTTRSLFKSIASIQGVENVQTLLELVPLNFAMDTMDTSAPTAVGDYSDLTGFETGTKVMNFDAAWAMGLSGQNQIVGMADTGLDSGDINAIHPDFKGAVKSGYAVGMFGKTWADPMGHGTHVAGSVLGRGTASGGKLLGGAFSAQIVAQGMWSPILNNLSVPSNLELMFNTAYTDGARIHTNSWGGASNMGAYEKMAASVDQVMFEKQDMLILFAAGNSGVDHDKDGRIDAGSVGIPGTAKNALTVGASENLVSVGGIQRPIKDLRGAVDSWGASPIFESMISDNINGVSMFSSRGPTTDGRVKPEIVAPGTNILSVHSQQPGVEPLWGLYNNDYAWSGGTSMACPLAAGAAAVTRQFLIEKMNQPQPTSALLKAYLLHTAFDMYPGQYGEVGQAKGQELLTTRPNSDEGYGRVDMAKVVTLGTSGVLLIADNKTGLATGESAEFTLNAPAAGKLQVNIVWTDAPGSVNASKALVNDLDLEVVLPNGQVLAVNDAINNNVYVQGMTGAGAVTIRVKGINVPMGIAGKQPFALVASVQ
ncbi:MAG: S8 family serine peptidase [Bdellovibrio sp.]|nr:S8 family serine peptidase [Bdellovibrio sp.]